jgi:hypothetical protein
VFTLNSVLVCFSRHWTDSVTPDGGDGKGSVHLTYSAAFLSTSSAVRSTRRSMR